MVLRSCGLAFNWHKFRHLTPYHVAHTTFPLKWRSKSDIRLWSLKKYMHRWVTCKPNHPMESELCPDLERCLTHTHCIHGYGCESWTLTAFENKCYRRIIGISYKEHKTNKYVWQLVNILAGRQKLLLSTIKRRRKLSWFGHVCRRDTLPKIILQATVDGSRRRGMPLKSWKDNIKEWTGRSMSLLRIADGRGRWAVITADPSVGTPQRRLGVTGVS